MAVEEIACDFGGHFVRRPLDSGGRRIDPKFGTYPRVGKHAVPNKPAIAAKTKSLITQPSFETRVLAYGPSDLGGKKTSRKNLPGGKRNPACVIDPYN